MRTSASLVKSQKVLSTAIRRGAYTRSQRLQALEVRRLRSMRGIDQGRCWAALSILGLRHRRSPSIRGRRTRHLVSPALCLGICVSLRRKKVELRRTSKDQLIRWWAGQASSQSTRVKINLSMYQNLLKKPQVGSTCLATPESSRGPSKAVLA